MRESIKRIAKIVRGNKPDYPLPNWPKSRGYDLHMPSILQTVQSYPLVICIHGYTHDGRQMADLTAPNGDSAHPDSLNSLADEAGFAVVYPYGTKIGALPGRCWNAGGGVEGYAPVGDPARRKNVDDVQFFRDLLEDLRTTLSNELPEVYLLGISNGGAMAQRLATECPGLWKAVATVAGCNQYSAAAKILPQKPIPVLHVHGDKDTVWPYHGGEVKPFGLMASVQDSVGFWVKANSATLVEERELLPIQDTDPTRIRVQRYEGQADVELHSVLGGGHAWPGGYQFLSKRVIGTVSHQFQAHRLAWDFFQRQRSRKL